MKVRPHGSERSEDIRALAQHSLSPASAEARKQISTIAGDLVQALCRYSFPGKVQELRNEIEGAVWRANGSQLEPIY